MSARARYLEAGASSQDFCPIVAADHASTSLTREPSAIGISSCAVIPRQSPQPLSLLEIHSTTLKMSGKYVFSKALKELRFLHCQTSEHSNAVRYA
jgi:hypothetical protein